MRIDTIITQLNSMIYRSKYYIKSVSFELYTLAADASSTNEFNSNDFILVCKNL